MKQLSEVCGQLKPHIVHLFGDGAEELKKLIIKKLVLRVQIRYQCLKTALPRMEDVFSPCDPDGWEIVDTSEREKDKVARKPEYGDLRSPSTVGMILERITFSREFVAVDFNYEEIERPTVYLPIEEVQKACYPKEEEEEEERYVLHLSDWNYQDKYYEMPESILLEFAKRIKEHKLDSNEAWQWLLTQVDFGQDDDKGKPIKTGEVNMHLEAFFLDWENAGECIAEWDEYFA